MSLQRKLMLLFGTTVLLVLALFAGAVYNAKDELASNQQSQHSFRRLILMDNLMTALLEAESSQRAYIIGNGPTFLEQFQHYRRNIDHYLLELDEASSARTANHALIKEWHRIITERVEHMDETLKIHQTEGAEATMHRIASNVGKQRMDRVREVSNRLQQEEQANLVARNSISEKHSRRLGLLLGVVAILNLVILGGAYRITERAMLRGSRSIRQLKDKNTEIIKINQLSSSLQSYDSIEESADVFKHFMRLLFPGDSGGLYLMRASRNLLELIADWNDEGESPLAPVIEPNECWGLRLGTAHVMQEPDSDLCCPHQTQTACPYVCIPLLAQSDIIGLLHMQVHDHDRLPEIQLRAELLAAQRRTGGHPVERGSAAAVGAGPAYQTVQPPLSGREPGPGVAAGQAQ